jgi:hypothetical protein
MIKFGVNYPDIACKVSSKNMLAHHETNILPVELDSVGTYQK